MSRILISIYYYFPIGMIFMKKFGGVIKVITTYISRNFDGIVKTFPESEIAAIKTYGVRKKSIPLRSVH